MGLLYAHKNNILGAVIGDIILRLIAIQIVIHSKHFAELREAICHYNCIVGIALVLFSLKLLVNLGRMLYVIYSNYCTQEERFK